MRENDTTIACGDSSSMRPSSERAALGGRLASLYLAPAVLLIELACRALEHWAPLLSGEERMGN